MIVVAGEALIDILVAPDGRLTAVPGGGPFNTARTIGRLDGAVAFLGVLSTDRFGVVLREALVRDGVDLSMAPATDAPTTLAIAELDEAGTATYRFHTAETSAPGLSPDAVAAAIALGPEAVHVGTLGLVLEPMASALASGIAAADERILVMLDPNCRPSVILDRAAYLGRLDAVLARTDIVKASVDDLGFIEPGTSAHDAAGELLDRGPAVVLVTDGDRPVRVLTRDLAFDVAAPPVAVVDSVGSGDAFGGAFLAQWAERGLGRRELADPGALREAVSFAIRVAGVTCGRAGADPPTRAELGLLAR